MITNLDILRLAIEAIADPSIPEGTGNAVVKMPTIRRILIHRCLETVYNNLKDPPDLIT